MSLTQLRDKYSCCVFFSSSEIKTKNNKTTKKIHPISLNKKKRMFKSVSSSHFVLFLFFVLFCFVFEYQMWCIRTHYLTWLILCHLDTSCLISRVRFLTYFLLKDQLAQHTQTQLKHPRRHRRRRRLD